MTQVAYAREPIDYPASDGQPMAETDDHRDEMAEIILTLKRYFRGRPDVYVSGNLLLYYEEGNPGARRAPDVFVALGVPKRQRRTYRLWEEGLAPSVVIEVTSKETKKEDQDAKPRLYADLGVEYLFLYDPKAEYLDPPLRGMRLGESGTYHRLAGARGGPFACPPLGLDLLLDEDGRLQFVDRETSRPVERVPVALDKAEEALKQATEQIRQSEAALELERERSRRMAAEIERLKAQLQKSGRSEPRP